MKREIEKDLLEWKNDPRKRPLLVRGARQVGKSYTITKFAKRNFKNTIIIDFELNPEYKQCFDQKDPVEILKKISILAGKDIIPGNSLLFLDEIQACPAAIESLRYFFEKKPKLHVIGAGSLLEFALEAERFKMPVGRVSFLYMTPLSFREFLNVTNDEKAAQAISDNPDNSPLPDVVHNHLLKKLKYYMILGGMPAVISEYIQSQQMQKCRNIQSDILQSFQSDFGKYATKAETNYLQKVFNSSPVQVGRKFRYAAVDPDIKTAFLRNAIHLLEKAGIIHLIKRTHGSGIPLNANAREKGYKIIFMDVGLMQSLCGLDADILQADDLVSINAGAVSEQLVGQELIAYSNRREKRSLFYWERNAKNSSAEVDYLISKGSTILPLEVKSGTTGKLKSLKMFMSQYHIEFGHKISQDPFGYVNKIKTIPLYAISTFFD